MARSDDWRDEASTALAVRHLPSLDPRGPVLVMEDPRDELVGLLERQGLEVTRWHRRARRGRPASAWPGGGPYGTVALRLPRAKEELEMLAHAAASLLEPEGRLFVYGAKDEGAGSAGRRLEEAFGSVWSVATGGRCRLLQADGPAPVADLRAELDDWALETRLPVDELDRPWVSFPGVFAHGRLDEGTALLLELLPPVADGARVLDFGCGDGVVGGVVRARWPGVGRVDFLDVDAVALAAVERNVPGARRVLSEGWPATGGRDWDAVVSNPPFHRGKSESLVVVRELVRGAPARLSDDGRLTLVVQRRLSVGPELELAFRRVEVLGDRGVFRVWHAAGPRPSDS